VTRGNHYHHTKTEKFFVVGGEGIVRMRQIESSEVLEYKVRGEAFQVDRHPAGVHPFDRKRRGRRIGHAVLGQRDLWTLTVWIPISSRYWRLPKKPRFPVTAHESRYGCRHPSGESSGFPASSRRLDRYMDHVLVHTGPGTTITS